MLVYVYWAVQYVKSVMTAAWGMAGAWDSRGEDDGNRTAASARYCVYFVFVYSYILGKVFQSNRCVSIYLSFVKMLLAAADFPEPQIFHK